MFSCACSMTIKASQCRALFAISYLHHVVGETEEVERWDRVVEKYNNSQSAKLATDMFEKLKSVHWQYEEMLTALLTKWPHIINDYPTVRDARVRFPIFFS